jgi:hypothetical protein
MLTMPLNTISYRKEPGLLGETSEPMSRARTERKAWIILSCQREGKLSKLRRVMS